ncbi:MAG TPA: hypothetical protein VD838_07005 [Anaeromyxobacteraceae bacterium]|nr:hypothetical protein [Anaeromyxobacteraceae bacterium]
METTYGTDPMQGRGTGSSASGTEAMKGQVSQLKDQAQHRAIGVLDDGKSQVCEALDKIAGALDQGGNRFGGIAADYARRGSAYLRGRSANELWSSASDGIRSRPAALVGVSLIGGFALARLLRR